MNKKTTEEMIEDEISKIVPLIRDIEYGDSRDNIQWREEVGKSFEHILRKFAHDIADQVLQDYKEKQDNGRH